MKKTNPIEHTHAYLRRLALAVGLGLGLSTGTAFAAPANDNFANAIDLTGAGAGQTGSVTFGDQTGTNSIDATVEAGEPVLPQAAKTVWFKWTSPGDGDFTFQTNGSTNASSTEWDAVIGIYTGASVNALTPLGTTPKDTVLAESMTITVTPGTTYYIQLGGFQDEDAANIFLTWSYFATIYQADMLSFGPGGVIGPVIANAADIAWTVPFGSNLATLAPTFTLSVGATCTVDGNPVVSGTTIDFSSGPKDFVVTAKDNTVINTYTVTATPAPPPTDGTWITNADSTWSNPANWQSGNVAEGADKTAFFTANITANRIITVDAPRIIGNITFTDSTTSSNDLTISGANVLTLDVTAAHPIINVTQSGNRQLTINSVLTGNDGLQKNGVGILNLGGNNTYTGPTIVNDGLLSLGTINLNGFGGGAGSRDISVAAGKIIQRVHSSLNAEFMKRLVETEDEFAICTTGSGPADVGTGNVVDFSSSTNGADLPNAFFASFATNGAQCRYNGTIIPASDNYRIGYPGTNGALAMIQPLTDIDNTPRGLIIGGATPVLVAENTFSGDTVLRAGRLFLGRNLALQNSALNVGNGAGDGITGLICFLSSNSGGATQGQLTDQPTLGGLIGARNLASIYNSGNQNNTSRLAVGSVLGLTLDVDSGKTHTYSGNARLATGMYLTKTGPGTQVLSGANDYTGPTNVNGGTLSLVGGSHRSPITVATGASLAFTLGSPTTSIAALNMSNGTVKINGTVDNSSDYKLMTASNINVTPVLHTPITDYELQRQAGDTELWLVYVGASGYPGWSGGPAADVDSNKDGVPNGVAWALGAANPNDNALGLLPTLDNTSDPTYVIFTFNRSDLANSDPNTAISVEYDTDLAGPWTTAANNGDDIIITETAGSPTDQVQVKFKRSTIAPAGRLFARLKVVVTP